MMKKKIVVGMSGGVDSAVAAYILKRDGYDVTGVTLRTWESGEHSRCCEIDDASYAARVIGIPFHVINCSSRFEKYVKLPFSDMYLKGLTPDPCIECNRYVKWDYLLYAADIFGAEYVGTGHYAKILRLGNGRYTVGMSGCGKDQSYMLSALTQAQLSRTVLPLSGMEKDEVRRTAKEAGIPVFDKPDSVDVCFAEGDYTGTVRERAEELGKDCTGPIKYADGRTVGRHDGFYRYTVGQRKGTGAALGRPVYVTQIDAETKTVTVGEKDMLYKTEIRCSRLSFMSIPEPVPGSCLYADVKIRYAHIPQRARITFDGEHADIRFDTPVRAPAPGQTAVFYDENKCITGSGVIMRSGASVPF